MEAGAVIAGLRGAGAGAGEEDRLRLCCGEDVRPERSLTCTVLSFCTRLCSVRVGSRWRLLLWPR